MSSEPDPTGAVPPPPPPPPPPSVRPGELGERLLARIIDAILLGVVIAPVAVIIALVTSGSSGTRWFGSMVTTLLGAVVSLGYFAFMESSRGQTVGKMILSLKTLGPNGDLPTLEQALRRNSWMALSLIGILPLLGGFIAGIAQLVAVITIAVGINTNTATRQAWHDTFAGGTRVVKVG
jgi:uncharacterized RDD family membrane protein YckC